MEKQKMETETIARMCQITGLTLTTFLSVGQEANMLIHPITWSLVKSGIIPRVSRGQRSCAYLVHVKL